MKKKLFILVLWLVLVLFITACRKADVVKYNIQKDADYFNVYREITFVNLRSDKILYQGEGYFSLQDTSSDEIGLVFRVAKNEYKIVYLSKHENVAYVINQIENTHTDPYYYEFKLYVPLPKFETDEE